MIDSTSNRCDKQIEKLNRSTPSIDTKSLLQQPIKLVERQMHELNDVEALPNLKFVQPGDTIRETMNLDGQQRDFYLHISKKYDPSRPTPLLMLFNGYGDSPGQGGVAPGAAGMEQITGMSLKADETNFLVIYMDGNPKDKFSWNNQEWWFSEQDDLKFTQTVLASIQQDFNVDPNRLYLAGFSQGGSFVHRVANEMHGKFAAIATVSTWMTGIEKAHSESISVLNIHSKDDPTVPFDGRILGVTMKPQKYIYDHYASINGITQAPETLTVAGYDGTTVDILQGLNLKSGAEVKQVFVHKEGHLWFGGDGDKKSSINATDMIIDFLFSHSKTGND